MYACALHDAHRKQRIRKSHGQFRSGEVNLDTAFWNKSTTAAIDDVVVPDVSSSSAPTSSKIVEQTVEKIKDDDDDNEMH